MTRIKRKVKKTGNSHHVILPKKDFPEGTEVWIVLDSASTVSGTSIFTEYFQGGIDYDKIRQIIREELREITRF